MGSNKLIVGVNDLATVCPILLKEWDYDKNGELKPENVAFASNKKVWWKCSLCGNEWQAMIASRTRNGDVGCRKCKFKIIAKKLSIPKFGKSLEDKFPNLVIEWNDIKNGSLTPNMINCHTHREVWWKCQKCGYEWKSKVSNRTSLGEGCPKCASVWGTSFSEQSIFYYLKMYYSYNVFSRYKFKDIKGIFEVDIYLPELKIGIEYDGRYWHKDRVLFDDLKAKRLEIMGIRLIRVIESNKNEVIGNKIYYNFVRSFRNKHFMNLTWAIKEVFKILNLNSDIINVEKDSSNIMSFFYNIKKEQSLNDVMPNLAKEWDYEKNGDLLPTQVSCGSDKKVWWKCEKGHEWHARISSRVKGSGCPYCSGRYVVTGVNDLALLNINLTKEWNYEKNGDLLPSQVSCGSSKAVWWKCQKCGYEWKSRVSHRSKGVGCPVCSGHQVLTGYNDLSTLYPSVAQEWNYDKNGELLPMQVSCGSKKKVWWICNKGHEWKATVYSRTGKKHSGCPECAKERIGIANSLPKDGCSFLDLKPDLAKEWNYEKNGSLLPNQVSYGSGKKVWWICSKGHEWQAYINNRNKGFGRCPECAKKKK